MLVQTSFLNLCPDAKDFKNLNQVFLAQTPRIGNKRTSRKINAVVELWTLETLVTSTSKFIYFLFLFIYLPKHTHHVQSDKG